MIVAETGNLPVVQRRPDLQAGGPQHAMAHDETSNTGTIAGIASGLGLLEDEFEPYGSTKGKVALGVFGRLAARPNGKLVLVTAMSPTPAGEGKTTVSIGLGDALRRLGVPAVLALRQPSMGPVFGKKGGGTGGGRAELVPPEEINLHFTGDLHALAAANNLLAAMVDNHLHWGSAPDLEPRSVMWKRCLDVNDRALRRAVVGLGGRSEGVPRETGFDITAASEVMAVLSLAGSWSDLSDRLERIVVGVDRSGAPVTAGELRGSGAMAALLRDALQPNLVRTRGGTPALVHGGPFGNIAHGCSSVVGTRMALKLGGVCITEAGFGADLGAEKFVHIKAAQSGLSPDLAVLVMTVRALKLHGGVPLAELETGSAAAVEAGFGNAVRHFENLRKLGLRVVGAVNRFEGDTVEELETVTRLCTEAGVPVAAVDVWARGGEGGEELAALVIDSLAPGEAPPLRPLYGPETPLAAKIEAIARGIYGAATVRFDPGARDALRRFEQWGFGSLPMCIAKTQYSFSDDPEARGAPHGHTLRVTEADLCAGAGFIVAHAGNIVTMPGLPRHPGAERIGLSADGRITGLF